MTVATTDRPTGLDARGEPQLWLLGGALAFGVAMIVAFLALVAWNGLTTFWPKPIDLVTLTSGEAVAGEVVRRESFVQADGKVDVRTLYRTGNFDLSGDDFRWLSDGDVKSIDRPTDLVLIERMEWGVFIGRIRETVGSHADTRARVARLRDIERHRIGDINRGLEAERLALRRLALKEGGASPAYAEAARLSAERTDRLRARYEELAAEARAVRDADAKETISLADVGGKEKRLPLSAVVRIVPANDLGIAGSIRVYVERWIEFLADEPREANTEGGVMPAIFGTFAMTLLLVIAVAPFGVVTALYLREYAKQGRLVSIVRISVNNLAGVPSIVYGVFGLGFFAYTVGGGIDQLFFPERLPSPTFGTGGILWSSLTLALLTVPVVIVATEEALAAVPRSMREGALACGASKWQMIRTIVMPRALPGIMTGLILAMARGAGEVAPLMLVGVVKLAPELPIDGVFPYLHLERSFMHLGFHIYDVGFQSRNSEAGKPMVFVTTLLLILLIAAMNATAIAIRSRFRRRFVGSQF